MFESFKETPLDYLLVELSSSFYLIFGKTVPASECYAILKENYCSSQRLDYNTIVQLSNEYLALVRGEVVKWNLDGRKIKDVKKWTENYFIKNHETIEDAQRSLKSGEFVNIIPASDLFDHVLSGQIPQLCDGKFYQTSLKSASSGTKNYLISEIQSCLRKLCYVESRINRNIDYNELLSIQNAIRQLRRKMKK